MNAGPTPEPVFSYRTAPLRNGAGPDSHTSSGTLPEGPVPAGQAAALLKTGRYPRSAGTSSEASASTEIDAGKHLFSSNGSGWGAQEESALLGPGICPAPLLSSQSLPSPHPRRVPGSASSEPWRGSPCLLTLLFPTAAISTRGPLATWSGDAAIQSPLSPCQDPYWGLPAGAPSPSTRPLWLWVGAGLGPAGTQNLLTWRGWPPRMRSLVAVPGSPCCHVSHGSQRWAQVGSETGFLSLSKVYISFLLKIPS